MEEEASYRVERHRYHPATFANCGGEVCDARMDTLYSGFEPIARHIVLYDGDGVTRSDLRLFTCRNRGRPLYSFERDM